MNTVNITEEQLHNLDEFGKELFNDEKDPRSITYIRKLKRPPISWIRIIFFFIIPSFVVAALFVCLRHFGLSVPIFIVIAVAFLLVYIILTLKQIIICIIKIYQRYAPDLLRNKCRFEPSCSEYMILAIEKYGLLKGLHMGICRLKRCNIDGGGFDFP